MHGTRVRQGEPERESDRREPPFVRRDYAGEPDGERLGAGLRSRFWASPAPSCMRRCRGRCALRCPQEGYKVRGGCWSSGQALYGTRKAPQACLEELSRTLAGMRVGGRTGSARGRQRITCRGHSASEGQDSARRTAGGGNETKAQTTSQEEATRKGRETGPAGTEHENARMAPEMHNVRYLSGDPAREEMDQTRGRSKDKDPTMENCALKAEALFLGPETQAQPDKAPSHEKANKQGRMDEPTAQNGESEEEPDWGHNAPSPQEEDAQGPWPQTDDPPTTSAQEAALQVAMKRCGRPTSYHGADAGKARGQAECAQGSDDNAARSNAGGSFPFMAL